VKSLILKAGKEKPLAAFHHWIFSGAIATAPDVEPGSLVAVKSHKGEPLGTAYYNPHTQIAARMVAFGTEDPFVAMRRYFQQALSLRQERISPNTNAFRLVNGEGDRLPGLVIDRYHDLDVLQCTTLGMEKLKPFILECLEGRNVYEKSVTPSRREEGLKDVQQLLQGTLSPTVSILENGLRFDVDPVHGQKTGFFLDHREMRQWARTLASGKRVLNAFCYTGGFSVYALAGGAMHVDSVDISETALHQARHNSALNGFSTDYFITADVFDFLRQEPLPYDLLILDPPAFAKKKKDIVPACRGYKDINRLVFEKAPSGSLLLTASCSYYVDSTLFQQVLFQAAAEARREVQIIGRHRAAIDHPVNLFHPEGDYLKSFLLLIR